MSEEGFQSVLVDLKIECIMINIQLIYLYIYMNRQTYTYKQWQHLMLFFFNKMDH